MSARTVGHCWELHPSTSQKVRQKSPPQKPPPLHNLPSKRSVAARRWPASGPEWFATKSSAGDAMLRIDPGVYRHLDTGGLDGLKQALQHAIELEHATMPPYLYALYSLGSANGNTGR